MASSAGEQSGGGEGGPPRRRVVERNDVMRVLPDVRSENDGDVGAVEVEVERRRRSWSSQ